MATAAHGVIQFYAHHAIFALLMVIRVGDPECKAVNPSPFSLDCAGAVGRASPVGFQGGRRRWCTGKEEEDVHMLVAVSDRAPAADEDWTKPPAAMTRRRRTRGARPPAACP